MSPTTDELTGAMNTLREENRDAHNELYDKADKLNVKAARAEVDIKHNQDSTATLLSKMFSFAEDMGVIKTKQEASERFNNILITAFFGELFVIMGLLLIMYFKGA